MSKYGRVTPHLTIKGALEAIKFYEEAFDAEVEDVMMAEDGKRVMHASLEINDASVFLVDEFPEYNNGMASPAAGIASVTIHLELKKPKQVDRIIAQAKDVGAEVVMPAMDAFWGQRYGRVRDPFGHVWSFGAELKKKDRLKQSVGDKDDN